MVDQYIRWDFLGLSTDAKPTAANEKVTNGSTYYESDTSKYYVYYEGTWYEKTASGGSGTSDFDQLTNRPKYNGAAMTSETNIPEVTTYSNFVGTDGQTAGTAGLVPAPATTDAGKFLKADGTWDTAGGGGPTVVQTIGTSTTDVMSQNAASNMVYKNGDATKIKIGSAATNTLTSTNTAIAIGVAAVSADYAVAIGGAGTAEASAISAVALQGVASGHSAVAIGIQSSATARGAVAIGRGAKATNVGQFDIGTRSTSDGYNSSLYRLLSGLYDGQGLHDAATVAQGNTLATSAPTTSTVGVLGQLYTDTTNMHTYQCTAIDTTDPSNPSYTWTQRW